MLERQITTFTITAAVLRSDCWFISSETPTSLCISLTGSEGVTAIPSSSSAGECHCTACGMVRLSPKPFESSTITLVRFHRQFNFRHDTRLRY